MGESWIQFQKMSNRQTSCEKYHLGVFCQLQRDWIGANLAPRSSFSKETRQENSILGSADFMMHRAEQSHILALLFTENEFCKCLMGSLPRVPKLEGDCNSECLLSRYMTEMR